MLSREIHICAKVTEKSCLYSTYIKPNQCINSFTRRIDKLLLFTVSSKLINKPTGLRYTTSK